MAEPSGGEHRDRRESFTGPYCVVILPDADTAKRAEELTRKLAPHAKFQADIFHITLFQGQVDNLPIAEVKKLLEQLSVLQGQQFQLGKLEVFSGQYLFWDMENTLGLQAAHEQALELARYVNREKIKIMPHQGLSLDAGQRDNAEKYGFPLSGDSFLPHITLAADPDGIVLPEELVRTDCQMVVAGCRFGEMGKNGRVENLTTLD